jgi:hypothetical protein
MLSIGSPKISTSFPAYSALLKKLKKAPTDIIRPTDDKNIPKNGFSINEKKNIFWYYKRIGL